MYISQAARGQTAGREAGLGFFDHLLTDYTFRKLYIDVYEFNRGWLDGSGGEELGLVKEEGHFRGHVRRDGRLWDVHRYAIYRDRWMQIRDFIRALYGHHWILPGFDWAAWGNEMNRTPDEWLEYIPAAPLEDIRKLLTAHVRNDRFCEGHLAGVFESGEIAAIMRRVKALGDEL